MSLFATTTGMWVAIGFFGATTLLLLAATGAAVWFVVERCIGDRTGYDSAVDDVQSFLDLTERSRAAVRDLPRLPLFGAEGADELSTALHRAHVTKDQARRALWASRRPLDAPAPRPRSDERAGVRGMRELPAAGLTGDA